MNSTDLQEYLRIAYELESSLYQQNSLIHELKEKADSLGCQAAPTPPNRLMYESTYRLHDPLGTMLSLLGLCAFAFGSYVVYVLSSIRFFWILGLVVFGSVVISVISEICKATNSDLSANNKYKKAVSDYEESLSDWQTRNNIELREKAYIEGQLPDLEEKSAETKKLLGHHYDANVIYPKYRSLIPISSFYDYILSTRCYELGGPNGAYNLYESESRMDIIVTQLDKIIDLLSQIKANQFMMYQAITKSNQINERLVNAVEDAGYQLAKNISIQQQNADIQQKQLDKIERNSALVAHETELARKEAGYRSRIYKQNGELYISRIEY